MNPEPEKLVEAFAIRTRVNLEHIDEMRRDGKDVYDVTQLINSCLGLLVFPQQRYKNGIRKLSLRECEAEGWPIPKVTGNFREVSDLSDLIRYLRNAISHFNIELLPNAQNNIAGLKVWNTNNGKKTWEAELSIEDLRKLVLKFSEEVSKKANQAL